MKWILVIALSLLLVSVCVVYFHHGMLPPSSLLVVTPPATTAPVPHKIRRAPLPKPGPTTPLDISGPLKDRELVSWVLPDYPDWAQEQGITGTLRMKIWVTPAGKVQSFMEPVQLSPDARLQDAAVQALQQWQFAEKPDAFGDQWGVITIRFALLAQEPGTTEASIRGVAMGGSTTSGAWQCVKQWIGNEFTYICRLVPHPSGR